MVQPITYAPKLITLHASGGETTTAGTNGTAVQIAGVSRMIALLEALISATEAGDTLDVYVDISLDNSTWLNAIHFTQQAGNGAAFKEFAVLDPSAPGVAVVNVTADAAAAAVRPSLFGMYIRARWVVVDTGGAAPSHTFSVVALVM
jgi:hypothetical protein